MKMSGTVLVAALAALGILQTTPADAIAITGPVNLSSFTGGATYGPAAPARFAQSEPVNGGTTSALLTGPNYDTVSSLLLVVSGATLPVGEVISLSLNSSAPVTFTTADFVTTATAGFPSHIGGIGNGDVNGVVFSTALHAGAGLTGLPAGLSTDQLFASVRVTELIPTNLRVDIFGVLNGRIINNTSNGGALGTAGSNDSALGITASDPLAEPRSNRVTGPNIGPTSGIAAAAIPEPASLVSLGTALLGLVWMARRRRPR